MKRLLLIAYFYPPLGGPAVQRPIKTIKYLTQMNWEVDVITVGDIIYHSTDQTLSPICRHKSIYRTPSLDLMYILSKIKRVFKLNTDTLYQGATSTHKNLVKRLFPIDEKVGWLPFMIRAGRKALKAKSYDAVMVTCNPFSAALGGMYLARKANIPFILDYRDHWTLNNAIEQPRGRLYKLYQKLEKHVLSKADLITTATGVMKQNLIDTFGKSLDSRIITFYNGWDEADFANLQPKPGDPNITVISYFGALYRDRTIAPFLEAVKALIQNNSDIEIHLVGNYYSESKAEIFNSGISHRVKLINQLPHKHALEAMFNSDILLLIIGDDKLNWVLTGKLFEYLRTQKPILALAPNNGEAAGILRSCGHESICDIHNAKGIQDTLNGLIDKIRLNSFSFSIPHQYERSEQVKIFASKLNEIIELKRNAL